MKTFKALALAALIALPMSTAQAQDVTIPQAVVEQVRLGTNLTQLSQTSGFTVAQLEAVAGQLGLGTTTSTAGVIVTQGGVLGVLGGAGGIWAASFIVGGILLSANSTSGTN